VLKYISRDDQGILSDAEGWIVGRSCATWRSNPYALEDALYESFENHTGYPDVVIPIPETVGTPGKFRMPESFTFDTEGSEVFRTNIPCQYELEGPHY
jgi:hypothetical protein